MDFALALGDGTTPDQIKANEERDQRPRNLARFAETLGTTVHYLETGEDVVPATAAERLERALVALSDNLLELRELIVRALPPPQR